MYSFPNLELVCGFMFGSNCCFFTCIQVSQEAGQVVWYSHLFPCFFLCFFFFCFFYDSTDVGNLISVSCAFSKSSSNIWKFTVHVLFKPGLENFEHDFTSVWNECNHVVVWAFFGIALHWNWNENWPFPVPWPVLSSPDLLAYWVQHFHSIIF